MKLTTLLSLQILLSLTIQAGGNSDTSGESNGEASGQKTGSSRAPSPTGGLRRENAFHGLSLGSDHALDGMQRAYSSTATSGDATPWGCGSSSLSPRRMFTQEQQILIRDQLKALYAAEDDGNRERHVSRIANANDVQIVVTENNGLGVVQTAVLRPEQPIVFMVYIEHDTLARIEFRDLRTSK